MERMRKDNTQNDRKLDKDKISTLYCIIVAMSFVIVNCFLHSFKENTLLREIKTIQAMEYTLINDSRGFKNFLVKHHHRPNGTIYLIDIIKDEQLD